MDDEGRLIPEILVANVPTISSKEKDTTREHLQPIKAAGKTRSTARPTSKKASTRKKASTTTGDAAKGKEATCGL